MTGTHTQSAYVLELDEAGADLATVGGKGASLATLRGAGLPVPPGFHVTTAAYRRFVAHHGLDEQILDSADGSSEGAAKIAALFAAHDVPDEIAEDLPGASFAGQQDTFLDVRGADAVVNAVRRSTRAPARCGSGTPATRPS